MKCGNIESIKLGLFHSIIKTNNNEFYSFGDNINNCLLLKDILSEALVLPTMIDKEYIMNRTQYRGNIMDIIPGYNTSYILQI